MSSPCTLMFSSTASHSIAMGRLRSPRYSSLWSEELSADPPIAKLFLTIQSLKVRRRISHGVLSASWPEEVLGLQIVFQFLMFWV